MDGIDLDHLRLAIFRMRNYSSLCAAFEVPPTEEGYYAAAMGLNQPDVEAASDAVDLQDQVDQEDDQGLLDDLDEDPAFEEEDGVVPEATYDLLLLAEDPEGDDVSTLSEV